jgi:hypothetical protein
VWAPAEQFPKRFFGKSIEKMVFAVEPFHARLGSGDWALLMLFLILVAFVTGLFLGLKKRLGFLSKFKIIPLITLLLLFSMGTEIGQSQEIMANLNSIGLNAFLIALFAVLGSFLVTLFFLKLFKTKKGETDD